MKNNKLILTGLFLTGAVSCASFRPTVLLQALTPASITNVDYEDLNWATALFNQYGSGLSYEFRMDYSSFRTEYFTTPSIVLKTGGVIYSFTAWNFIGSTYATATLDSVWTQRVSRVLFNRNFNSVTKLASNDDWILFRRNPSSNVNFEIGIKSRITYSVTVGSVYLAQEYYFSNMDQYYSYIQFFNSNDEILQQYDITGSRTNFTFYNELFNLSTVLTNVKSFRLFFQGVDIPPLNPGGEFNTFVNEFNLFTQGQEIVIPEDTEGDTFGFEFVAVEWYNILGHLQNFAWWIVNKSPIAPVFEWLDTYIVSWISGLITFIVGVFNL